jgi:hypothetical protein
MCTTRCEIEEEQLAFIRDFAIQEELESAQEEQDTKKLQHNLNPISDVEEDEALFDSTEPLTERTSQKSPEKRQKGVISDISGTENGDDDHHDMIPFPLIPDGQGSTQQRVSGRVRKRSRLLDG